jgi:hypothetical protein
MALRKGKIVEAALVQRSGGAGEKEERRSIRTENLRHTERSKRNSPLPLCNSYAAYRST